MGRSPHTALELIELATLLRKHVKMANPPHYRDELHSAIAEIEARAHSLAGEQRTFSDGGADPYARINMII